MGHEMETGTAWWIIGSLVSSALGSVLAVFIIWVIVYWGRYQFQLYKYIWQILFGVHVSHTQNS